MSTAGGFGTQDPLDPTPGEEPLPSAPPQPAAAVAVDDATFDTLTGSTLEEVLANVDAMLTAHAAEIADLPVANPPGTLAARPANGSQPNGSTYYATDDNGGQTYVMTAGAWAKRGPAVGDASGRQLAYQELAATWATGNVAAGNADNDMPGMQIAFVSGSRPFQVSFQGAMQYSLGAAATGSVIRVQTKIQMSTDGGATWTTVALISTSAKVATGEGHYTTPRGETTTIVPPAAGTAYVFKVMTAVNVTNAGATFFGRNLGATTCLKAVEQ